MAARQPLNDDERRPLRITARMPLASVANLAPVLDLDEEKVRRMLGVLRRGGWVTSVVRGMTERRQHRWFLTRQAVDLLYVTGHQHPASREEARASGLAAFHPEGELPEDYRDRLPWTTTIRSTWRTRATPHSPPVTRLTKPTAAPTTSTRPGPLRLGASRAPCAGWPCWSRSTAWPPTCSTAGASTGPPTVRRTHGRSR